MPYHRQAGTDTSNSDDGSEEGDNESSGMDVFAVTRAVAKFRKKSLAEQLVNTNRFDALTLVVNGLGWDCNDPGESNLVQVALDRLRFLDLP